MALKKNYLIEKRNVLNEIRANSMSLQELRFFSIYLAKINSRDMSTRVVTFPLADFQKIMELGKLNIGQLKETFIDLLCKVISVPNEMNGFDSFQLFKKVRFYQTVDGDWFVEIDAHDDALPLMFEFKERYFTYELWNALKLKSSNQLRMYEILKQYERVGERIVTVAELKELLGIDKKDYARYNNFRLEVLDVCQRALVENTDITFTYEPTGKRGRGGKVISLKFTIQKNENHVDRLSLEEFIDRQDVMPVITVDEANADEDEDDYFLREIYPFMAEACNNEFNQFEIQVLYNLVIKVVPYRSDKNNMTAMYDYLKLKYDELKWRASQTEIKNRMGYLKSLIKADVDKKES